MDYLGNIGAMVPVPKVAALRPATSRASSVKTTVGGVAHAQLGRRTFRQWDVALTAASRPEDLAGIASVVNGEYGIGPFWWVDSWAQVTNILSPKVSGYQLIPATATVAGAITTADGRTFGKHLIPTDSTNPVWFPYLESNDPDYFPIIPGEKFTVSAWVSGDAVLSAVAFDAAGVIVDSSAMAFSGSAFVRRSITMTAPTTGVAARIRVVGANRIAGPAVTWTDVMMPYHVGQGASSVIVTDIAADVLMAAPEIDGQYASSGFTIREVG